MTYNKIYAVIGEERHIVLDPINYQYDVKQILVISGETLPEYYEADICNVGDTATLTMIGTAADGVEIPDKFLLDGRNVLVYVVIPGSGGDVQTRYDITIPVDERAEREDIDPSEAEQQQIDSLINALNSGVGRAEAAATTAAESATDAEGSAGEAEDQAENAEAWAVGKRAGTDVGTEDPTYHNNSKYYAGRAEAAAEEAGQHEASWETWVQRAESAADDAEGSARAAAGSKADAEAAAQTATQKATKAGNSAAAAAGSAASARQTVDDAIGAINEAKEGAVTQIGSAGSNAVASVNQAGTTQTGRVTNEGNTQVNRVQTKGDEVLDSIPQDYSDLVDDVADLTRQLSDVEDVVFTEVGNVQIFNKNTVDIKQLNVISSKVIYDSSKKNQCVCIPIAITAGDTFYVKNFVSDSEVLTDIDGLKIFITNTFEIGDSIIEFGSSNYQNLQGYITASSNANYLGIQFSFATEANVDTYIQKIINLLVVAKNTGTYPIEYVDYYTVNVVSATQDISDAGKVLAVDNNGKIVPQDAVKNIEVMTLRYSADIISSATITAQTGWVDNGDGSYTHTSGTSSLRCLLSSLTAETPYVVAYDITPYTEASVLVRLGDNIYADGYNGTSHCMVGFMTGTDVTTTAKKYIDFKPTATYAGTISNIHCYRIDELGTNEITLPFYDNVSLPLESNVTGFWNCVLSPDGMQCNVNGTRNTVAGYRSLASIISGNRNVAIGSFALAALLSGERNIAIGSDAMYTATGGSDNVAIGKNAMIRGNDSLKENVGIGNTAMSYNNADAIRNVIIGFMAGYYAANKNVSVGYKAGYWTRGDENTSVGYQAGVNNFVTGNNNIAIGANTGIQTPVDATSANPATISNTIVIGNGIKATSDGQFVVGSQYTTDVIIVADTGKRKIIFNNDGTITWEAIS